jgi:hypothetical protein
MKKVLFLFSMIMTFVLSNQVQTQAGTDTQQTSYMSIVTGQSVPVVNVPEVQADIYLGHYTESFIDAYLTYKNLNYRNYQLNFQYTVFGLVIHTKSNKHNFITAKNRFKFAVFQNRYFAPTLRKTITSTYLS